MGADLVIRGEGEKAIVDLARAILKGERTKAGVITTGGRLVLDDYLPFSPKWHMFGSVEITRGCPLRLFLLPNRLSLRGRAAPQEPG